MTFTIKLQYNDSTLIYAKKVGWCKLVDGVAHRLIRYTNNGSVAYRMKGASKGFGKKKMDKIGGEPCRLTYPIHKELPF